jgi:hypothetical protein
MSFNISYRIKTIANNMYSQLLGHCRLTNIPAEYSIRDIFAKLVTETRDEIIHKHVVNFLRNSK